MNHQPIRGSAVVGGDLLGPLKRSIARPCPADGVMGKSAGVAPGVQMWHVDLGVADDSIERHHLVVSALRSAFCTSAVIADDVDKQGVIHYAHFIQGIHQTSYLFVGMLGESSESLHLPGLQFLLFWSLGIPGDRKSTRLNS